MEEFWFFFPLSPFTVHFMKWPGKYITHPWHVTEWLIQDASVGALAPEK